jgi:hypothetical protein
MSTTTVRSTDDRIGGIVRMIRALGRDGTEWELSDLRRIADIEDHLFTARDRAIGALRDSGHTDGQIAEALGVTRQAVSKRWPGGGRYVGAAGRYRDR